MNILNFVIGYTEYCCALEDTCRILNGLMDSKTEFFDQREKDGKTYFCVFNKSINGAMDLLCLCTAVRRVCLSDVIKRALSRPGLVLGAVFCLVCMYVSTLFLWDIHYTDGQELEELMTQSGLKIGAYIPDINEDIIEIRALMNTDKYSYISININGTHASVDCEKRQSGMPIDSSLPSNLVAGCDGVIVRYEVYSGDGVCSVGQTVSEGQLLISGIDETKHHGSRIVRARGAVYASTEKEFTVSYPVVIQEKRYTGNQSLSKSYFMCGMSIDTGDDGEFELYDTESKKEKLKIFGAVELPIYVTREKKREYMYAERTLTEQQARYQAQLLYFERLKSEIEGCQVLSRSVKTEFDGETVSVHCRLSVIQNIAKEVPITVG